MAEVSALWLGAANPLLLMHLVAGIHNEALMLGLMLTGTEFALRGIDLAISSPRWPRGRAQWTSAAMLLAGVVLITMSSQVKVPGLLALGFVAMALAWRWGGTVKAFLLASSLTMSLSLAVMAFIGWISGLGFGWLFTLGTANVVRSWMSPPTLLALGTGQVGILLGLGVSQRRSKRTWQCDRNPEERDHGGRLLPGFWRRHDPHHQRQCVLRLQVQLQRGRFQPAAHQARGGAASHHPGGAHPPLAGQPASRTAQLSPQPHAPHHLARPG